MASFTIAWQEVYSVEIEAESFDEALEKWGSEQFDKDGVSGESVGIRYIKNTDTGVICNVH